MLLDVVDTILIVKHRGCDAHVHCSFTLLMRKSRHASLVRWIWVSAQSECSPSWTAGHGSTTWTNHTQKSSYTYAEWCVVARCSIAFASLYITGQVEHALLKSSSFSDQEVTIPTAMLWLHNCFSNEKGQLSSVCSIATVLDGDLNVCIQAN